MPQVIHCTSCNSPLRVREELAGKSVKCPKCSSVVKVPAAGEALPETVQEPAVETAAAPRRPKAADENIVEEVRPRKKAPPPARTADDDEEPVELEAAEPSRKRRRRDDDDEDDRPRRGGAYAPCPKCGARNAQKVAWTIWGSFYFTALFTHVRCLECGAGYNGRSGRSNIIPAIICVAVPALLIVGICSGLGWLVLIPRGRL